MKLRTKLTVMLLALLVLLGAANVALAEPEGDYSYKIENGEATITKYTGKATELTIPATLGGYPVTAVGNSAFYGCYRLTTVTIPDSVTSIGSSAFYGCTRLTTIVIPDSVTSIGSYPFSDCSSLTTIAIPDSLTSIGTGAFSGCTSLTTLTLPDSVISIGGWAFDRCTHLTTIAIPESVTSIGSGAFSGCSSLTTLTLPSSVTSIGSRVFHGCSNLTSITIPNSVTSIGQESFMGCTRLPFITIPDSVTSIGKDAFKGCTRLTTVSTSSAAAQSYSWPAGVRVGMFDGDFSYVPVDNTSYCLMNYAGDASVVIVPSTYNGKPVTQIDNKAFNKSITLFVTGETPWVAANPCWRCTVNADGTFCLAGTNITNSRLLLPAEAYGTPITAIGNYAFAGMDMSFVHIPDSIVTVGENPFRGCTNLTTIVVNPENTGLYVSADGALYSKTDKRLVCFPAGVTASWLSIPAGVQRIGAYAMYGVQVTEIGLPDSVIVIGEAAFAKNRALQTIRLPDGITEIPVKALYGCSKLSSLTLPAGLMSIRQQAFEGCSALSALSFPDSLTSIGLQAFYDCDGLSFLTFPASLTGIGDRAFEGCNALQSVTFPEGTQTIGWMAFTSCPKLQWVTLPASVTSIGADAFTGAPLLTLHVQPGSKAATYARENPLHALYPDSDAWLQD